MVWVKMKSLCWKSSKRIRRTTILKKLPSSKNRSKRRLSLNSQKSPKNKLKASKNHKKIKIMINHGGSLALDKKKKQRRR